MNPLQWHNPKYIEQNSTEMQKIRFKLEQERTSDGKKNSSFSNKKHSPFLLPADNNVRNWKAFENMVVIALKSCRMEFSQCSTRAQHFSLPCHKTLIRRTVLRIFKLQLLAEGRGIIGISPCGDGLENLLRYIS
ncbi:hypothetical protein CDAR_560351 [Caerostris darwini]|uniref:Uncharacterized protein n=1 Tax=Caerostris darwini TaxID=1538125 RepID=A0AAV4VZT4_9ARAC|nr:hypothetical protein CDAR_560091 [Caerostris darwini]GIY75668.1 hypothetical protein CDAR_560351 [Caerostris darwini]